MTAKTQTQIQNEDSVFSFLNQILYFVKTIRVKTNMVNDPQTARGLIRSIMSEITKSLLPPYHGGYLETNVYNTMKQIIIDLYKGKVISYTEHRRLLSELRNSPLGVKAYRLMRKRHTELFDETESVDVDRMIGYFIESWYGLLSPVARIYGYREKVVVNIHVPSNWELYNFYHTIPLVMEGYRDPRRYYTEAEIEQRDGYAILWFYRLLRYEGLEPVYEAYPLLVQPQLRSFFNLFFLI